MPQSTGPTGSAGSHCFHCLHCLHFLHCLHYLHWHHVRCRLLWPCGIASCSRSSVENSILLEKVLSRMEHKSLFREYIIWVGKAQVVCGWEGWGESQKRDHYHRGSARWASLSWAYFSTPKTKHALLRWASIFFLAFLVYQREREPVEVARRPHSTPPCHHNTQHSSQQTTVLLY